MGNWVKNDTILRCFAPTFYKGHRPADIANGYHTFSSLSTKSSACYGHILQGVDGHCSIPVILKFESIESVISHGSRRVPRLPTAVFRFNSHVKKERCFSPRKNPCFCSIYSITTLRYDGHRQKLDVPPLITPRNSFQSESLQGHELGPQRSTPLVRP